MPKVNYARMSETDAAQRLAEPGLRNPVLTEISPNVEPHVLAATLTLVTAAVCDALTLIDPPPGGSHAPCSMRISSTVALLALAAPRIAYIERKGRDRMDLFCGRWRFRSRVADLTTAAEPPAAPRVVGFALSDQRVFLALPLCFFALAGLHYGTETTRRGDAVYTVLVLLAAVHVCASGGIENQSVRPDNITTSPHRRQTVSGLCAALLVYVGLRGVRSAYVAADEVQDHAVQYSVEGGRTYTLPGHAQISLGRVVPLAFGHGTLVCTGLLIATSGHTHLTGSSIVAYEVGMAGAASAVAAFWATLAYSETIDEVPSLYGPYACSVKQEICVQAFEARRFDVVNASVASLWLAALGAMLYAVAIERRILGRARTRAEQLFQQQGVGSGGLVLVAAVAAVYVYGSLEGAAWYIDACVGVALVGVFAATFTDVVFGAFLSTAAFGVLFYRLGEEYGTRHLLTQVDGTFLLVSAACMAIYTLLDLLLRLLQLCGFKLESDSVMTSLALAVAIAGTSISFVLFVASALVLASASGAARFVYDASGSRTMLAYVAQHYLPLLSWIPIYTCRSNLQWRNTVLRVRAWHLSALVAVLVHWSFVAFVPLQRPDVTGIELQSTVIASVAGGIAWYVSGYV